MERKAVKFILSMVFVPVLAVSLPFLSFRSEAAEFFSFPSSQLVESSYGSAGQDSCVTVSFPSFIQGQTTVGIYSFYLYCDPVFVPYGDFGGKYYIDNVRMVIGGETFPASYQKTGNYLIQGNFDFRFTATHCSILIDVHRIPAGERSSFSYFEELFTDYSFSGTKRGFMIGETYIDIPRLDVSLNPRLTSYSYTSSSYIAPMYEGHIDGNYLRIPSIRIPDQDFSGTGVESGENYGSGSLTRDAAYLNGGTLTLNISNSAVSLVSLTAETLIEQQTNQQHTDALAQQNLIQQQTNQQHTDALAQQNLIQQQTNQQHTDALAQQNLLQQQLELQHADAQRQLEESEKQTTALTEFDGKSDMDENASSLGGALSSYDDLQGSIFETSSANISAFTFDSLFSFSIHITQAMAVWNVLITSIIAAMGDFSLIFTVGIGLVVIGLLVGVWRFFVK